MTIFPKINRTTIFTYGNENAAASFCKWLENLFDHKDGYTVIFDKELSDPESKQLLPTPCLVVNQIDTTNSGLGFMGADKDSNNCLFTVKCIIDKTNEDFGSIRLLRRMKDQVVFAIKKAGVWDNDLDDLVVEPIKMLDFSKSPAVELASTLTLSGNISQHFLDDGQFVEYELMLTLNYIIDGKNLGA